MSRPVKPSRPYDSSRRQEQARGTRRAVLAAARVLFLDHGYAATTLTQIASQAGVSVETVYKAFANKAGVLKAVFDVAVAGDDEPIPMAERDAIQSVIAEPDAARKITRYTDHLAATADRAVPVQLLARDAAAADPGAAAVWAQIRAETLTAMTLFARNLADTGQLTVPVDYARDVLWTYHAPELYELIVLQRRWSTKRYGRFLATAIITALLREPAP
jgi:AcrR family transcriptional regulator